MTGRGRERGRGGGRWEGGGRGGVVDGGGKERRLGVRGRGMVERGGVGVAGGRDWRGRCRGGVGRGRQVGGEKDGRERKEGVGGKVVGGDR